MGSNSGNVNSGTVDPSDAASYILSAGGSHGIYGKNIQYGSEEIQIIQTGYTAAQAQANAKYRTPTNYPFDFTTGEVFPAAETHTNSQVAFGPIWANYYGGNTAGAPYGYYPDAKTFYIGNKSGTNNFYLTGEGNFLMNQIGHLPFNSATAGEARLLVNSLYYISQRKQCEICAANQSDQQTVHFVRRINSANAETILTALQNGGTYWYPLDGCYILTEDITLPEDWESIEHFNGHWDSDVYDVTLNFKGTPLLANDSADGESGWNLGTDRENGTENVFDSDMNRVTGVARVVGNLNDLFGTEMNYAGYVVKILGSDNPKYMDADEVYNCTVNSDSKYVISNLPCVFNAEDKSGVLTARVYKPDGTEVTEYGAIRANVPIDFWDNDMTTPLYLGTFAADPVRNTTTYESAQAFFEAKGYSDGELSVARWEYKKPGEDTWAPIPSDWHFTVTNETGIDGESYIATSTLMLSNVDPAWNGYQFRAVFTSAQNEWNTYGFYWNGGRASNTAFDGAVYKQIATAGYYGELSVKLWPTYTEQGDDQTVYEGQDATFTSKGYALANGSKITSTWQYSTEEFDPLTGQMKLVWHDVAGSGEFGGIETSSTQCVLDPDIDSNIISMLISSIPNADINLFRQDATFYETTTSLTVKKVDIEQSGVHFRVKYTATTQFGTQYKWYSNIADELDGRWVNQDGSVCMNVPNLSVVVDNHSNILTVNPPELDVITTPSASFSPANNTIDTLTPDEYGQLLTLDVGDYSDHATGEVAYQAIIYYLPDMLKPTPVWQYRTFTDGTARDWNQDVARALTGSTQITVRVENEDLGEITSGEYAGYMAIKSTMYISNPPLSMYDSSTMTKYFFRCLGGAGYETVRGQKEIKKVDKWGGLSMDYAIDLQHNGVLTYGQKNIINGQEATSLDDVIAATDGKTSSKWSYPNLKIQIPDGKLINTAIIRLNGTHDSKDTINLDKNGLSSLGITVSQTETNEVILVSSQNDKVSTANWEKALRSYVTFTTYDNVDFTKGISGGLNVSWYIDENRYAGMHIDTNSGNAYKLVQSSNPISWESAKSAAESYNAEIGLNGKLVSINSAAENAIVRSLVQDKEAWLGASNNGGWKWVDGTGLSYTAWKGNPDTSKKYMYMDGWNGWDSTNGTTTSSKTYTFTNMLSGMRYDVILTAQQNRLYIAGPGNTWLRAIHANLENGGYKTNNFQSFTFEKCSYDGFTAGQSVNGLSGTIPGMFGPFGTWTGAVASSALDGNKVYYATKALNLNSSHKYYIQIVADSFGDNNGQMAGGLRGTSNWVPGTTWVQSFNNSASSGGDYQEITQIVTGYNGNAIVNFWNTGKVQTCPNPQLSPNANIYQYAIFDLTAAFGSNTTMQQVLSELGYGTSNSELIRFMKEQVNNKKGVALRNDGVDVSNPAQPKNPVKGVRSSATVQLYSQSTKNIYYYVVEYNIAALGMATTNHSATDNDIIGTQVKAAPQEQTLAVNIAGNSKVYDGLPIVPEYLTVTGPVGATRDLVQITYTAPEVGNFADYTTKTVNGADWENTDAINATRYHAKVELTTAAIAAGWKLDTENSQTECDLIIYQRPVNVYSNDNDRTYDGTFGGTITNLKYETATNTTGVVGGDVVRLNTDTVVGYYTTSDGKNTQIHNSITNNNSQEWPMRRYTDISDLYIVHDTTSDPHHNYCLGTETYTGDILPRGVVVHSRYLDDPDDPRNIKEYDGTAEGLITRILIDNVIEGDEIGVQDEEMEATYESNQAGETLINGQAQSDRFVKLVEYDMTPSENAVLTGNDYGDYFIEREEYTGAIYRASLTARVKSWRGTYGNGMDEAPWHDTVPYVSGQTASFGCWLGIEGLVTGDTLTLDYAKSHFEVLNVDDPNMTVEPDTPVGQYPLTYVGLSETNYQVLKNYIVDVWDGALIVEPREVVISVNDAEKMTGDINPPFYVTFSLREDNGELTVVGSDADKAYADMELSGGTPKDKVVDTILVKTETGELVPLQMYNGQSNIDFATDCTKDSPTKYMPGSEETEACEFCEEYYGYSMGTDHYELAGYEVNINLNPDNGNILEVAYVTNPLGEQVQNYKLTYLPGTLYVHPELRFQLKATVPLQVCMYGYRGTGDVVEPTNYGITNYSNAAIQVDEIEVSDNGWNIVSNSTNLKAGEMFMQMNGVALQTGSNIPNNPEKWIIPKDSSGGEDSQTGIEGVFANLPLTCYIAGGNVNDVGESFITEVTYHISEAPREYTIESGDE